MKILLTAFLLFNSAAAYAGNPWTSLAGCYLTEQRNGVPLTPDESQFDFGKISLNESAWLGFFQDLEHQPIPSISFIIFQKYSTPDQTAYEDYKFAFDHLGTYTSDENGSHFRFDGNLIFNQGLKYFPFTLHEAIDVKAVDPERYFLHLTQSIPDLPDESENSDNTYVIKRTECPEQN
jgi:hypothetical protein